MHKDVIQPRQVHPADSLRPRISLYQVAPGVSYQYERPRQLRWLTHIPRDLGQFPRFAFRSENELPIAGILAGSGVLWLVDEPILHGAQGVGRQLGLNARSTQKTLVHIPFSLGAVNLPFEFNVPDNLNSTFYYIGDGWTHLSVATSFWVYGLVKRDNRAAQTASQLGTAILSTGLMVQSLKRLTGRQSPFVTTKARGEWHLFPSYTRYQSRVPNYDAFPTGHLATAMVTVTVIADNYPEKHFVRPLGYGLMGLLGYAMLNNGVHWASDYPVGIALGYAMAKIAVRNGRTRVEQSAPAGTGFHTLPRPQPWYRQAHLSPYSQGPFTGLSATWQL
ncbi:phosphatase PAP2 family protein [Hymenobacter sp. BT178]|uniref:Phosphatase PAP2 family protein n=1 Tax=Hymenobacter lucidus TaxID=2880930 RepID=A0ABS8AY52_9BACT|nr:phosphatase PAP2 family protein [Hymenobacter lucidus]MCB2410708.1 phosphatase PAP2 family protein [Hymenobacter lucidus]